MFCSLLITSDYFNRKKIFAPVEVTEENWMHSG